MVFEPSYLCDPYRSGVLGGVPWLSPSPNWIKPAFSPGPPLLGPQEEQADQGVVGSIEAEARRPREGRVPGRPGCRIGRGNAPSGFPSGPSVGAHGTWPRRRRIIKASTTPPHPALRSSNCLKKTSPRRHRHLHGRRSWARRRRNATVGRPQHLPHTGEPPGLTHLRVPDRQLCHEEIQSRPRQSLASSRPLQADNSIPAKGNRRSRPFPARLLARASRSTSDRARAYPGRSARRGRASRRDIAASFVWIVLDAVSRAPWGIDADTCPAPGPHRGRLGLSRRRSNPGVDLRKIEASRRGATLPHGWRRGRPRPVGNEVRPADISCRAGRRPRHVQRRRRAEHRGEGEGGTGPDTRPRIWEAESYLRGTRKRAASYQYVAHPSTVRSTALLFCLSPGPVVFGRVAHDCDWSLSRNRIPTSNGCPLLESSYAPRPKERRHTRVEGIARCPASTACQSTGIGSSAARRQWPRSVVLESGADDRRVVRSAAPRPRRSRPPPTRRGWRDSRVRRGRTGRRGRRCGR